MPIELDYMEYANDAAARAAYVGTITKDMQPSDDSWVSFWAAGSNYGSETQLCVYYTSGGVSGNITFIKFNLSAIPAGAQITSATLYLYLFDVTSPARTIRALRCASDWNEGAITWNNKPGVTGGTVFDINDSSGAGWKARDITTLVQNWHSGAENNYGLRLWGIANWTVDDVARFYSKENATLKPYLRVVYKPVYSEDAIFTQGSYSLKIIAKQTDALNYAPTRTVSPTINLTDLTKIKFDIRASRTGSNIKILIRDSGGTWSEHTPNVTVANSWQTKEWNISGISNANKDAIDRIQIKVINAGADNIFYLDNMFANWWSKIFSEQIVLSDSFSRTWSLYRTFNEAITLTDTIIVFRMFHRIFTETIILSDTLKKRVGKVFTENITLADTLKKRVSKIFSETLTLSDTVSKKIAKTFTETLHLQDTFSRVWHIYRTFTETINLADTLRKKIGKTFIESLTLADTLVKRAIRQRANLLQALESDAMFPSGVVRNLQHGADAVKSISPVRGDWYISIDTQKVYVCFLDGDWTQIYP